jgi:hypothetical protein
MFHFLLAVVLIVIVIYVICRMCGWAPGKAAAQKVHDAVVAEWKAVESKVELEWQAHQKSKA